MLGRVDENECRVGESEPRVCEPIVLLLNRDGKGGIQDALLSRREIEIELDLIIILCRAVRSNTFFSVKGKNSVRWLVMSSLGGR